MVSVRNAVVTGLVVFQDRLIRDAQPEAVTAVVGLVPAVGVARRLGLEAVVVGVRGVVAFEHVATADPAVQGADEHAVAAVRDVVFQETVVVRARLDQQASRIASVDLSF